MEFETCSASSRVGVMIRAWTFPFDFIFSIIGDVNTRVFPLPVAEPPIISFPAIAKGIAFSWISVGFSNLNSVSTSSTSWLKPSFLKLSIYTFKKSISSHKPFSALCAQGLKQYLLSCI